jgi:general secretion pathway protein I
MAMQFCHGIAARSSTLNRRHPGQRSMTQRGLTLIEVLVAFVILSLSIGVVFQIFSGGLRNARAVDGYGRAVLLAESELATVGTERPLAPATLSGQVGPDMRWTLTIRPWGGAVPESSAGPRLFEVRMRVEWPEGLRTRHVELVTLRMGTAWGSGAAR